jgi:uncharacterized protein YbjT (DUF2867 family)
MMVLVCGAHGFIGAAISTRLEQAGHRVLRGVRRPQGVGQIAIDYTQDLNVEQWLSRLAGVDAVVNAVGIIVERGANTFDHIHRRAPIALFQACRQAGIQRIVQISALGADSRETPYFASKCAADDFLLAQAGPACVLRPSLVYGEAGASARLFRTLASAPLHALPAGGSQLLQPVHIDDLAELVLRRLESMERQPEPESRCIEVVGRTRVSYREMLGHYRTALGLPPAATLKIPGWIMQLAARIGDAIPGSLLKRDTLHMLHRGSYAEVSATAAALGRMPMGIEAFVPPAAAPKLRQQALAGWQVPLLRGVLAIVWLASGLISAFVYPHTASLALLARVGLHSLLAELALYGASLLDVVLGLATLLRPGRRLWQAQIAVMLFYSAVIAIALPEFLSEPFGPLLKNLPILALLVVLLNEESHA